MKCAECQTEKFVEIDTCHTLIGCDPEVMIDGVRHTHDLNRYETIFECVNGHRIEIAYRKSCVVTDCEFNRRVAKW